MDISWSVVSCQAIESLLKREGLDLGCELSREVLRVKEHMAAVLAISGPVLNAHEQREEQRQRARESLSGRRSLILAFLAVGFAVITLVPETKTLERTFGVGIFVLASGLCMVLPVNGLGDHPRFNLRSTLRYALWIVVVVFAAIGAAWLVHASAHDTIDGKPNDPSTHNGPSSI